MHSKEADSGERIDQLVTEWLEADATASPAPETVSILPIDVGIDWRLHGIAVDLSGHSASKPMSIRFIDSKGRERLASGIPRHVAIELRREGFSVKLDSEI